jgi:hypothetical protein
MKTTPTKHVRPLSPFGGRGAFLLLALLGTGGSFAQRSAPVSAQVTYIDFATKTVTCDLSWTGNDARHRDTVWLFVDFAEVKNNIITGAWGPATLTPAATGVTAATGNSYTALGSTTVTGNTRGVWVHGNASATNQPFHATVTLKLEAASTPAFFNACAYVLDYPPNLQFTALRTYQLHGTPPFQLTYDTNKDTTINDKNVYTNLPIKFFETLIDYTQCPGIINCKESTDAASICTGSAPALRIVSDQ